MCFDIEGDGGIAFCSSLFFSLMFLSSSALFRFLLRLPFERIMWAVLW